MTSVVGEDSCCQPLLGVPDCGGQARDIGRPGPPGCSEVKGFGFCLSPFSLLLNFDHTHTHTHTHTYVYYIYIYIYIYTYTYIYVYVYIHIILQKPALIDHMWTL
jgi:hypothetical protein